MHDHLEGALQELGVAMCLLLRARRHCVSNVTEHSVTENQCREVGCFELVHHLDEAGTVEGVKCSECTARKQAQLEEGSHRVVLGEAGDALSEPPLLLLRTT